MANFGRDALTYNYSWRTTEGDSNRVVGFPDNVLLNRSEGYEVLHFINRYMTTRNATTLDDFRTLERYIHQSVPGNLHSQANIRQWLDINVR